MPRDTARLNHGRSHSYRLDGARVSSVTGDLGDGFPKPGLINWAAGEVATYAVDHLAAISDLDREAALDLLRGAHHRDRDKAANRGTEVHRLAQRIAAGDEVDVPEELIGHVDSYLDWWDRFTPQDVIVEQPIFNRKWRYGGTFDLWARLPQIGKSLVDIKTNRSGPFGDTALQLAAYAHGEFMLDDEHREIPLPEIERYFVLWLRSDGFDFLEYDVTEAEFRIFLYVQSVARWIAARADWNASQPVRLSPLYRPPLPRAAAS